MAKRYHDLTPFIVEQLSAQGIQLVGIDSNDDNINAYCFRGHDSKTPSLRIHRSNGMFYCFGCGVRGSNWNAFAHYLDVETLGDDELPDPFRELQFRMERQYQRALTSVDLPWDIEPWLNPWRKIRVKTLKRVGAFRWYDDAKNIQAERILFPVSMYGKVKGWVARRTDEAPPGEKLEMPYRNAKHMLTKEVLFPLDYVVRMQRDVVVLVEGPYDALRLVNYNIPALAILGTNNYDPDNRMHILNAGANRVILAMDGDEGGDEARLDIAPSLREMFDVEHFKCPREKDPGNMPQEYLKRLWQLTR